MKKFLAIVLAMIMLVSALPMMSVGAMVVTDELELGTPLEGGVGEFSQYYSFTPDDDGWYKFYSVSDGDLVGTLYDSEENEIGYGDDFGDDGDFSFVAELCAGETYYLGVYALVEVEGYVDIQLAVEKAVAIESMEITQYPHNTTLVEGFEYDTLDLSGLEIKFTFSDGSTLEREYEEYGIVGDFIFESGLETDDEGNFYAYITCGGFGEAIPYTVVENPVESISVESGSDITVYENIDGYYDGEYGFVYSYEIPEDVKIKVSLTDGTSQVINYYDGFNGISFGYYDDQYEEKWNLGKNEAYINLLGATATIDVTVAENPIKNITVSTNPTAKYTIGDLEYGFYSDDVYYLCPEDLSGIELTVEYKDGTSEIITDEDFDMDDWTIVGRDYIVPHVPVYEVGTTTAYLIYMNLEITFEVEVVDGANAELLGDVDNDGEVTVMDATVLQRSIADLEELSAEAEKVADVDGDGKASVMDATLIQRIVAGFSE